MPDIPKISAFDLKGKLQNQLDFNLTAGVDPLSAIGVTVPTNITVQSIKQNPDGRWVENVYDQDSPVKHQNQIISKLNTDRESVISNYNDIISAYDSEVLNYNTQINAKKLQIVSTVNAAIAFGCSVTSGDSENINGVACGVNSTIYDDQVFIKSYGNINNYSSENPFSPISTEDLSSSILGKGFTNIITNNSGSNRGIYSTVTSITTLGVSSPTCTGYQSSINSLATEISTLRQQRDQYLSQINNLKDLKSKEELKRWGSKKHEYSLSSYNSQLSSSIDTISQLL